MLPARTRLSRAFRAIWLLTVLLSSVGAAFACGGGGSSRPAGLVPEGATILGDLDFAAISSEFDLESIFESLPVDPDGPTGFIGRFPGVQVETGVEFTEITALEFFGKTSGGSGQFGVIVHGRFDETAVVAELNAGATGPMVRGEYKGQSFHSPESDPSKYSLGLLDPGTMIIGTSEGIRSIIDVWRGDQRPASGELAKALDDLGDRDFGLVLEVSPEALANQEMMPGLSEGLGELPFSLDFFEAISTIGVAGAVGNDALNLRVVVNFTDEEETKGMAQFLDGFIGLASGAAPDPETQELLESLEVERNGDRLTISVVVPESALSGLAGGLTQIDSEELPPSPIAKTEPLEVTQEVAVMPSAAHVPDSENVNYSTTPPTSGEHWDRWADCGWYDQELPDERIVHNLEHGNIVVSYNLPDPEEVAALKDALAQISLHEDWGIARPYSKVPEGTVALSAWGRLAEYQGVSPGHIERFYEAYAGLLGPERIAC